MEQKMQQKNSLHQQKERIILFSSDDIFQKGIRTDYDDVKDYFYIYYYRKCMRNYKADKRVKSIENARSINRCINALFPSYNKLMFLGYFFFFQWCNEANLRDNKIATSNQFCNFDIAWDLVFRFSYFYLTVNVKKKVS